MLKATGVDLADSDAKFTWRKIHGAGEVTFEPNGTAESSLTKVTFDVPIAGRYLFEVTLSDSHGLTEVKDKIGIVVRAAGGRVTANKPPVAGRIVARTSPGKPVPILLEGKDPEKHLLIYQITAKPKHGHLTGKPPKVYYTSDFGYIGNDFFDYSVMDSEGQIASEKVGIVIKAPSKPVGLALYEPFDYPQVQLRVK
jgi:hypothetical protein